MKRYSYEDDTTVPGGRTHWIMVERDDGEYVKYADVAAELARHEEIVQTKIGENLTLTAEKKQFVETLKKGRVWYYCQQCGFLGTCADNMAHEDHTCSNCEEDVLRPVYMIPETVRRKALKTAEEEV